MNIFVRKYIEKSKDSILKEWTERMKKRTDNRVVSVVSDEVFFRTSTEFIELMISNLNETTEQFQLKLTDFAEKIVRFNWPLTFVNDGIKQFSQIVLNGMKEQGIVTSENELDILYDLDAWVTPLNSEVINMYTLTWERTVSLQKIALQELSAPLIPAFEGIMVMPLIGMIDTERAKQIMENLLEGAVTHRAEVVLIDITGVPVVDTMVAHHIIQAAEAVRLIGAKCMLVGIRPEIAQTIVTLGINLEEIDTKNTLKKGVEAALEMTNRKIVKISEE